MELATALVKRKQQNLYRSRQTLESPQGIEVVIDGRQYLSFSSNDYLGLANHPEVVAALKEGADRFGVGSGAAHLISGHSYAHQALEEDLAAFTGRPRALLFSTGYMANLGVVSALLGRNDSIVQDRLNHASLLDAARLSGVHLLRYRHNDMAAMESKLSSVKRGRKMIACDAVFSMDGDKAPLAQLDAQANKQHSWLLVDDAHGFGVLGEQGHGYFADQIDADSENAILMATLGKACGCMGAFVAGSDALIETLIQQARSYIYTTATPPALAWATRTALRLLREADEQRYHLEELIRRFRDGAKQAGLTLMPSSTPIQPVVVGAADQAMRIGAMLHERGILLTPIRPPTVPEGSSRLRITFSTTHTLQHVDRLVDALDWAYRENRQ